MIDGSLVLSGTAISDKQAPAFCTIEYAANNHDYKEIGLVAPWAFMLSSGSQKPLHFTIPISLPDEYKEVLVGMIRLIVYMDDVNVIPFDNESTQYDMVSADKRRLLIKAIMKEVSPSASQDTDFMDMPKTPHELLDPHLIGNSRRGKPMSHRMKTEWLSISKLPQTTMICFSSRTRATKCSVLRCCSALLVCSYSTIVC